MSPYFSIWLGSISPFLINHELFQVQICQSSLLQNLCECQNLALYMCVFKHSDTGQNPSIHGFGLSGLAGANRASASLNFLDHRKSKDGTRPSHGNPAAHTGVEREGCLLAQSRHITSLKIVPSSENSSLIWSLMAPWCNGSDSHKRLCAWMSIHIKCNN